MKQKKSGGARKYHQRLLTIRGRKINSRPRLSTRWVEASPAALLRANLLYECLEFCITMKTSKVVLLCGNSFHGRIRSNRFFQPR